METIGDRVRRIRQAKGIARKDLARDAGMSYSGLSDLELGKAKSTTRLHRLATLLEVDAGFLETGREHQGIGDTPGTYHASRSIDPEIVLDVARALHEAHEELGLTYNFTANPQLFIDAYQRAATFGNFSGGRGSAWLGSNIMKAVPKGEHKDERATGTHAQGVHKRATGSRSRKA
ncbi:helix-turn-helix transcriptional regulator [Dyella ginsengisoli]|uniref:Helix-turn-helix transcriptional regulator n=1 Tax=Dyella ginsengisoli TaxID=363848 RepID=A0ABW8JTX1_9GAMM